jgi:hypothetical protein
MYVWQAFTHGPKVGLKEKLADVLRAYLALIDADTDGSITRAEIRIFAVKVLDVQCTDMLHGGVLAAARSRDSHLLSQRGGWGGLGWEKEYPRPARSGLPEAL